MGEAGPGDCLGLLASKLWPTAVRGQMYGVAAAVGKIGAFVRLPFGHLAPSKLTLRLNPRLERGPSPQSSPTSLLVSASRLAATRAERRSAPSATFLDG